MTKNRQMATGEGILLGLTGLFLCFLFAVNAHDAGSAIRLSAVAADTTAAAATDADTTAAAATDADTSRPDTAAETSFEADRVNTADREQAWNGGSSNLRETAPPEGPAAAENVGKLDLNAATAEELETLPGIGPSLAERIVAYRREHGPFPNIEAVTEVSGIGVKKFSAMEPYIYVTT